MMVPVRATIKMASLRTAFTSSRCVQMLQSFSAKSQSLPWTVRLSSTTAATTAITASAIFIFTSWRGAVNSRILTDTGLGYKPKYN